MIYFSNVTKVYDRNHIALHDVTLRIHKGEFVCLVGPGGAGKTTFIQLAFGSIVPTRGEVFANNLNLQKLPPSQLLSFRRSVGPIFQTSVLISHATVWDNVALPLEVAGVSISHQREMIGRVLLRVGLENRHDAYPAELSGGECQRVSIARAIMNNPSLILADEPTQNLDKRMSRLAAEIFSELHDRGATVIVATHDPRVFEQCMTRSVRLSQGEIVMA